MKKRMVAMFMACILLVGGLGMSDIMMQKVEAKEYRAGYELRPEVMNKTGVPIDSAFLLSKEDNSKIDGKTVEKELVITPKTDFKVEEKGNTVRILPSTPFVEDKVYAFSFAGATWLYQTEREFYLESTLPAHKATEVPIDSGIEFVFSAAGAKDLEKYIEISPKVKGRFEQKGRIAVWISEERLKPETLYTVVVKKGLPMVGSKKKLQHEYAFQFETASKGSVFHPDRSPEFLTFQEWQTEVGKSEKASFSLAYYTEKETHEDIKVHMEAHRFPNAMEYIKTLSQKAVIPEWSFYGERLVEKKGLEKTLAFDTKISFDRNEWVYRAEFPHPLPEGYYLVEIKKGDLVAQTFLQVTDISSFYQETEQEDIVWLHKVKTGELLEKAKITAMETFDNKGKTIEPSPIETITTNQDGIALLKNDFKSAVAFLIEWNGQESVMYFRHRYNFPWFWERNLGEEKSSAWTLLYTDRQLYQPKDEVGVFGFVMPRYAKGSNRNLSEAQRSSQAQAMKEVEIEVSQLVWNRFRHERVSFIKENWKVKNGIYHGKLKLPNLPQGSYNLTVRSGNEVLSSQYFRVEEYVKPEYKISLTKEKEAIFWNEVMNINLKSTFFEGTPVSNLKYRYYMDAQHGEGVTDEKGNSKLQFDYPKDKTSGMTDYLSLGVSATLPEAGEIYANTEYKVFLRDVALKTEGKRDKEKAVVEGSVHQITLDRINNKTAKDSYDYLGKALAGHSIDVEVIRNKWIKVEDGEEYDYINKVVRKRYRWVKEEKNIQKRTISADKSGKFRFDTTLPSEENVYYTVRLLTKDQNNRPVEEEVYLWQDHREDSISEDFYETKLVKNKESYRVGDKVELELVEEGKVSKRKKLLYITAQNGYRRAWLDGGKTSFTYTEAEVPRISVIVYAFEGYTVNEVARENILYDYQEKNLKINAITDKQSYRPGDRVKIMLEVKKEKGEAAKNGYIHIKAIDEALLSLQDQEENPLMDLYQGIFSGMGTRHSSHSGQQNFLARRHRRNRNYVLEEANMKMDAKVQAPMANDSLQKESAGVRKDFVDRALFETVALDENGKATLFFDLPDNITAWRLFMTGITEELEVGSKTEELKVSLPFFVSLAKSKTYLKGDKTYLTVAGYGSELTEKTEIDYMVEKDGKTITKDTFHAFEKGHLELPKLDSEGEHKFILRAKTRDGKEDAIAFTVRVVASYHEKWNEQVVAVKEGHSLKGGKQGLTYITFVDAEKTMLIPTLYHLKYLFGERADQKLVANLARKVLWDLMETKPEEEEPKGKIDLYQRVDGGLSILPYGESDVEATVSLLPLLYSENPMENEIKKDQVAHYLRMIQQLGKTRHIAKALYGLAVLREPVLSELREYEKIENLSLEDKLYIALAYTELGDHFYAKTYYEKNILPSAETYQKVAKIRGEGKEESYALTSLAMLLTQSWQDKNAPKFFAHLESEYSKLHFVGARQMLYIMRELPKISKSESKLVYEIGGQEKEINLTKYPHSLELLSTMVKDLKIKKVNGKVNAVLRYGEKEKLKSSKDKYLKVERKYYVDGKETTKFKVGDIVEVRLTWDIHEDAPSGAYVITDFLPSGLSAIEKNYELVRELPVRWWWQEVENQKVQISVYRYDSYQSGDREHRYYARVVSAGEFKAEGIIMQGRKNLDHIFVGADEKVIIKSER